MLRLLRRLVRPEWRRPYHRALALIAAARYGWPARSIAVIGVTGTDGKTTTATLTAAALAEAGAKVGLSSTAWVQVGTRRWLNETHMTMPGRFKLQRLLRQMVDAGCTYAVLEVSSEGIAQGRLTGIEVDVAVVTNVSPEHIESHGTFEKYVEAKRKLFSALEHSPRKVVGGRSISKAAVINSDVDSLRSFFAVNADRIIGTSISEEEQHAESYELMRAREIVSDGEGSIFNVNGVRCRVNLPGRFNIANALQAIAAASSLGVPMATAAAGVERVKNIPGRFEIIDAGGEREVVIDYALTPAALRQFYGALRSRGAKKIVAVFGAAGGGRDRWKRPVLGMVAGELADHIILTSDDPFDEDPGRIVREIQDGVKSAVPVEVVLDRRRAIQRALEIAQAGDVIALTGMGSETSRNIGGGKREAWNDRKAVEELTLNT